MSEQTEKKFDIGKIYIKDASTECPNTPEIFKLAWEPQIELNVGNGARKLSEDDLFEVELSITVTAKLQEKTAYLIEIKQCGIFTIAGFNEVERGFLLGGNAPNILFPYAREAISELSQKAGFPAMLLNPINFEMLYQQHLKQQQEKAQATSEANAEPDAGTDEPTKH